MTVGSGVRWTSQLGAWLAIGTSPGALVLGAGIAVRNGGTVPLAGLVLGAAIITVMLYAQGLVGLARPIGEDGTLSDVAPRYLGVRTRTTVNALLAFSMIGWFGFGVGLGGAALAEVLGLVPFVGPLLIAVPIGYLASRGQRGWNGLAIVTTLAALSLVVVVALRTGTGGPPLEVTGGTPLGWLGDAGVLVGYVAVFSLRAPDFSRGLRSRGDLAACVGALVVTTLLAATAGASLASAAGDLDVVASLSEGAAPLLGNVLVTVAVLGALFGNLHSGSLAVRAISRLSTPAAMAVIAVPGTVLAIVRFDRYLVSYLELLAILLPPLLVPMAIEAARRRRGRPSQPVTTASWLPGALVGAVAYALDSPLAPVLGLAGAAVATGFVLRRRGPAA